MSAMAMIGFLFLLGVGIRTVGGEMVHHHSTESVDAAVVPSPQE